MKHKFIVLIAFLLFSVIGKSQDVITEPEMADALRSDGKIYVVIAVISIVFVCMVAYLIYIDLKLRKLENKK